MGLGSGVSIPSVQLLCDVLDRSHRVGHLVSAQVRAYGDRA